MEVADLDAATKWAEQIPTGRYGSVEVRQVVEY
ncbi:YciI family protein [Saccharopolyspora sp. NPDC050642]